LLTTSLLISGHVALKSNNLARARQLFEEVRTHAVAEGPMMLALTTASLGQIAMAMGDLDAAQQLFEQALALHQAESGPTGIAFGHLYIGQVSLAQGDHLRAARFFREAMVRFAARAGPNSAVRAIEGFAGAVATHRPERAARLLGATAAMREGDDWPRDQLEVPVYERTVATVRTALGEAAFEAAWNAGTQLSWEDVRFEIDALVEAITDDAAGPSPSDTAHGLTRRELEVLRLLTEGKSNRAIADVLSISERTVENHVQHILTKLDLDSRTAAGTWAVRHGLV
jgi:DNA-binding CsgD family transcriptional regulator